MASFNKITIIGHLGRDSEIRYLSDGTAVASFSIATSEKRKDRSGEMQESTLWFKATIWGKRAEALSQYLLKGKQVYLEGALSQQEYADKDGNQRTSLEVRISEIQLLGGRGDGEQAPAPHQSRPAQPAQQGFKTGAGGRVSSPPLDDDSEIPF